VLARCLGHALTPTLSQREREQAHQAERLPRESL